ncbi:MAG: hypothetical protein GF355_08200 [Candidatus Eisenbacteria bacterium]|nr:hypothetical protein [Candidatus Eisenbacteria bacterium]
MSRRRIALGLLLCLGAGAAGAETWTVRPDGSGDFPTLQAAVNAAADGDEIILAEGVFAGDGNRDVDPLGKQLLIRSALLDPSLCMLNCEGTEAAPHRGFVFRSGEGLQTRIQSIGIANGYAEEGGAIYLDEDTGPLIRGCLLTGNAALRGGAVYSFWASPQIDETTIVSNRADRGGGIYIRGGAAGHHTRCIIWGNCAPQGSDVFLHSSAIYIECTVLHLANIDGEGFVFPEGPLFEVNPLLCNPLSCDESPGLGGDYHLQLNSPCLPESSPCGALVGALGAGCQPEPTANRWVTWGQLKSTFGDKK